MKAVQCVIRVIPFQKPLTLVGEGSVSRLGAMFLGAGWEKPLVMTDQVLMELGIVDPLINSLKEHGIECIVFDGVEPDPTYDVVNSALSLLKKHKCDSVIALGGGSSIDAAKVVKIAATHNKPPHKFAGMFKAKNKGLPFIAVPTTAGTGSEVTIAAVISDSKTHKKTIVIDPKLLPNVAVLDPQLHVKLPPAITAATALDALTHAVEAYFSTYKNDESDAYALSATNMIFKHVEDAYSNGENIEAREQLAIASYYAGLAFTKTSLGYVHAIAHQLGAEYQIPHGVANALILEHVTEFNMAARPDLLAELSVKCGLGSSVDGQETLARLFLNKLKKLNKALGIPQKLPELQEKDISRLAKAALREARVTPYPVPRIMSLKDCEKILQKILIRNEDQSQVKIIA